MLPARKPQKGCIRAVFGPLDITWCLLTAPRAVEPRPTGSFRITHPAWVVLTQPRQGSEGKEAPLGLSIPALACRAISAEGAPRVGRAGRMQSAQPGRFRRGARGRKRHRSGTRPGRVDLQRQHGSRHVAARQVQADARRCARGRDTPDAASRRYCAVSQLGPPGHLPRHGCARARRARCRIGARRYRTVSHRPREERAEHTCVVQRHPVAGG